MSSEPLSANNAVLVHSEKLPENTPIVSGYEWNNGIDYSALLNGYINCGFQATNFGKAILEINRMVRSLLSSPKSLLLIIIIQVGLPRETTGRGVV